MMWKESDTTEQLSLPHSVPVKPCPCLFPDLYTLIPSLCVCKCQCLWPTQQSNYKGEMQTWLQNLALDVIHLDIPFN